MNTIAKRTLSGVIASKSIAKNTIHAKYKNICNTTARNHKRNNKKCHIAPAHNQTIDNCNENTYKRQKKTHYNEKMEPIRLSSTGTSNTRLDMPKRIREVVWNTYNGETYSSKCYVPWCSNVINVFNYQVGHDIPESKGGTYDIGNLRPICSNCNLSMGNKWTIQEWSQLVDKDKLDDEKKQSKKPDFVDDVDDVDNTKDNTKNNTKDNTKDNNSRITFYPIL